jgi:phosphatidylserine decarboxylase
MRIDPAGWPFVIAGLILAILTAFLAGTFYGVILLAVTTFFLFFFRDPDRTVVAPESAVLAPADGRVMVAGEPTVQAYPASSWRQISIFLSPVDVHVNRLPIGGKVVRVAQHRGRFLPAYRQDAGDLNEYTEVVIDHHGQTVVVRQIVGVLARRIVCRVQQGASVKAGDRFGVMKFGSRMDIFLPLGTALHAQVGDKVVGGVTVIATLPAA